MSRPTLLTKDDMDVINEQFGLDLEYSDATHYRAATVIWTLWKADAAINQNELSGPKAGENNAGSE